MLFSDNVRWKALGCTCMFCLGLTVESMHYSSKIAPRCVSSERRIIICDTARHILPEILIPEHIHSTEIAPGSNPTPAITTITTSGVASTYEVRLGESLRVSDGLQI